MNISDSGITFLKKWEGFRAHSYSDGSGDSIGYGHQILIGENFSNGVTLAEADAILRRDAAKAEAKINNAISIPLTQSEFDALVSFAFNTGRSTSDLYRLINERRSANEISAWWTSHYTTENGVYKQGVADRRKAEASLFFSSEKKN